MKQLTPLLILLLLSACATVSPYEKSGAYMQAGDEHFKAGEFKAAFDNYDAAIQVNPGEAYAYLRRGNTLLRMARDPEGEGNVRQQENKALANYFECLRINPNVVDAYFNRAMIWAKRANYKSAAQDLIKVTRLRPQDPESHLLLGQLYEERFEEGSLRIRAMQHYEKYMELGGQDEKIAGKVQEWKRVTAPFTAPQPETTKPEGGADVEKMAQDMFEKWQKMFQSKDDRQASLTLLEELLEKFSDTEVVKTRRRYLEAVLRAIKPKEEPPKQP